MTSPQEGLVTLRTDGKLRLLFSRVPRPCFSARERGSIAFVGSLLPAHFVVKNGASLNVQETVVLSKRHEQSYTYVARQIPGVVVSRLRGGSVGTAISIVAKLLMAKALRHRVIFFHECCWPVFDLLISVIRPAGLFWPQVTMNEFQTITAADLPKPVAMGHKVKQRLFIRFGIYRAPKDSVADGHDYLFAFRRKQATHWTRLSCHRLRANEVRLQLSVLAYNWGNLWRRLVLPKRIEHWSLTSLQQRLVKTGARLVKYARYYWLFLAESHLTRRLFRAMLQRVWALPVTAG